MSTKQLSAVEQAALVAQVLNPQVEVNVSDRDVLKDLIVDIGVGSASNASR